MAAGAVSGNGVYSDLEYQGKVFKVGQWTNDAMDAVGNAAFRKAKRAADDAQEKALITRMYSVGHFSFDAVAGDLGLNLADDLLAVFLFHLVKPHHPDITEGLCLEMVRDGKGKVLEAVSEANPRKERTTEPAATAPTR